MIIYKHAAAPRGVSTEEERRRRRRRGFLLIMIIIMIMNTETLPVHHWTRERRFTAKAAQLTGLMRHGVMWRPDTARITRTGHGRRMRLNTDGDVGKDLGKVRFRSGLCKSGVRQFGVKQWSLLGSSLSLSLSSDHHYRRDYHYHYHRHHCHVIIITILV
jgi:hypothetical protein